jgi:hypothetical protein
MHVTPFRVSSLAPLAVLASLGVAAAQVPMRSYAVGGRSATSDRVACLGRQSAVIPDPQVVFFPTDTVCRAGLA